MQKQELYLVTLPLHGADASYTTVDAAKAEEEGFEVNKEYFEPIKSYHFFLTENEAEAQRLVQKHKEKWS